MRRFVLVLAVLLPLLSVPRSLAAPSTEISTTNTITATVDSPAAITGRSVGRLSERSGTSQTLLVDGSVLLAGGIYSLQGCPVSAAELYNAKTGRLERVGSLLYGRGPSSTRLLEDGRVFVQNSYTYSCDDPDENPYTQVYNPATRTFEPTPAVLPRFALNLGNGAVLAYSGREIQVCRPQTRACTQREELIIPRTNFAATRLANGDVLITGGTTEKSNAEVYTPSIGDIALTGTPTITTTTPGVLLEDGRVLFSNRRQAEIYNPETRIFTPLPAPNTLLGETKFRAPDGNVIFLDDEQFVVYNPTSNQFTPYYQPYSSPYQPIVLPDARILFVGINYRFTNDVSLARYVPANTFTGSLNYPTSWVKQQTIKVTVRGTSTSAPVADVGLESTFNAPSGPRTSLTWTPIEPGVAVSRTVDLLTEGRGRPVTMYLRDTNGATVKIATGKVNADLTAPVTQMEQLPTYSRRNLVLKWSGSDNLSGIEGYAVEMRVGPNGTWQRIASNVTKRSAGVSGTHGQQLFFRVRGRDVAGNFEPYPATYDTQTTIDTIAPTGVLDVSFVGEGSVQVLVASQDQPAGTQDMRVGFSYNFDQAPWEAYATSKTLTRLGAPAGCLRVYGQFRDRAGNVGPIVQTTVPGTGCP